MYEFELIARTCASGRGGPLGVQPEDLTTSGIARLRPFGPDESEREDRLET